MDDEFILPLVPIKDNFIVEEWPTFERTSPGGIVMPDNMEAPMMPWKWGVVLAMGPGMTTEMENGNSQIPPNIKLGSIILFHAQAGWKVEWPGGEDYIVVSVRNVEAVVDDRVAETLKEAKRLSGDSD